MGDIFLIFPLLCVEAGRDGQHGLRADEDRGGIRQADARCSAPVWHRVDQPHGSGTAEHSPSRANYELHEVSTYSAVSAAPILEIRGLNIKSGELPLFDAGRFAFTLHAGQRVALEGKSGLGKTRLLRAIAQLDDSLCGTCTLQTIEGGGEARAVSSTLTLLGHRERTERSVKAEAASYALWRSRVIYIPQVRLHPLAAFEWNSSVTAVQRQCVVGLASCGGALTVC
jgi:hypothetical protein